jgi:hypothetical protein
MKLLASKSNLFTQQGGARGQFCPVDHVCISDPPFNQKIHKQQATYLIVAAVPKTVRLDNYRS